MKRTVLTYLAGLLGIALVAGIAFSLGRALNDPASAAQLEPTAAHGGAGYAVTRGQAEQIAIGVLDEGRVTGSRHEHDYGAKWRVDVTLPDNGAAEVYIAPDGRVLYVDHD